MGYRLKPRETVDKGIRRVVREQIARAAECAADKTAGQEKRVHEVRTRLKRTRAALALVDDSAGGDARPLRRRLGKRGRRLARARDLAVGVQTFEVLRTQLPPALSARLGGRLELAERRLRRALDSAEIEKVLRRSGRALEKLRRRVGRWRSGRGRRVIAAGITDMYRRARRALGRAREDSSPARVHEWRKRVKALGYQLRLVGDAVPELATLLAPKVERLGDVLGQVHDLDCAARTIERHADWFGAPPDREALLGLVEERRGTLEREAFTLAESVFAGRPRDLRLLIETSWRSWRRAARRTRAAGGPPASAYLQ